MLWGIGTGAAESDAPTVGSSSIALREQGAGGLLVDGVGQEGIVSVRGKKERERGLGVGSRPMEFFMSENVILSVLERIPEPSA